MGCSSSLSFKSRVDPNLQLLEMTTDSSDFIKSVCHNDTIFLRFDDRDMSDVIKSMKIIQYKENDIICKANTSADTLYIILDGECSLMKGKLCYGKMKRGDIVGDKEVIIKSNWPYTCKINSKICRVAELKKSIFDAHVRESFRKYKSLFNKTLVSCVLFHHLNNESIRNIEAACSIKQFKKGDMIIKQGEKLSSLYVIKTGTVRESILVSEKEMILDRLEEFEYFGQEALENQISITNIFAVTKTELVAIDASVLNEKIKNELDAITTITKARTMLVKNAINKFSNQSSVGGIETHNHSVKFVSTIDTPTEINKKSSTEIWMIKILTCFSPSAIKACWEPTCQEEFEIILPNAQLT